MALKKRPLLRAAFFMPAFILDACFNSSVWFNQRLLSRFLVIGTMSSRNYEQ
jgi:hypothetical protein